MATLSTILLLAAITTAQKTTTSTTSSSTLSIPFLGYDISNSLHIDASIVGLSPDQSTTTLALACAPGTDSSDCGLFPLQTLTIGPSIYNMFMSEPTDFVGTQNCAFSAYNTGGSAGGEMTIPAATAAVCTESASGSGANDPGVSTTTYTGTEVAVVPVTVTAGGEKLGAAAATTGSTGSAATGISTSTKASATQSVSTITGGNVVTISGDSSTSTTARSETSSTASGTATRAVASSSSIGLAVGGRMSVGTESGVLGAMVGLVGYFLF